MAAKASPSPFVVSCIRPDQEATWSAFYRHFLLAGVQGERACEDGVGGGTRREPAMRRVVGDDGGGSIRKCSLFRRLLVIPCSPNRGVPSLLMSGERFRI